MQADGVIVRYALGGAVGAALYRIEVDATDDVDVYIILDPLPGQSLVSLSHIHHYLEAHGWLLNDKGYSVIADWQVQFLPADNPLLKEALKESVEKEIDGAGVRVFPIEHLAAVAFAVGRPKDKLRLPRFLESEDFKESRFSEILQRHDLLDRWIKFKNEILD